MCKRLEEAKISGAPVNLSMLYRCLTADVICEYAFSQSYGFLKRPEESKTFFDTFAQAFRLIWLVREVVVVNWFFQTMAKLPSWIQPPGEGVGAISRWQKSLRSQLQAVLMGEQKSSVDQEHTTIFEEYQRNKLPIEEKTEEVQYENAQMLVGAGFETTGSALSTAHYHLLANPDICQRLRDDIDKVWPSDQTAIPPWATLEKIPYLKAVIQESLRMSIGVMSRLPRVNHHTSMKYGHWLIPPGTPVGMSQRFIHFDPSIFPNPQEFDPERWLQDEKSKALEKYLVSFSRGARSCIGMHLSQAEMYLAIATIFRRFDMELYETTRREVDAKLDFFVPFPESTSGVRVFIK